jgi:hypothetical protein
VCVGTMRAALRRHKAKKKGRALVRERAVRSDAPEPLSTFHDPWEPGDGREYAARRPDLGTSIEEQQGLDANAASVLDTGAKRGAT